MKKPLKPGFRVLHQWVGSENMGRVINTGRQHKAFLFSIIIIIILHYMYYYYQSSNYLRFMVVLVK